MASTLSLSLAGNLDVRPAAGNSTSALCSGSGATSGLVGFSLGLLSENRCAAQEISQSAAIVDGAPVALPFPSGMQAKVFYLRVKSGGPVALEVTTLAGSYDIQVAGLLLLEPADADLITGVLVDGTATFEWLAAAD